MIPYKEVLISNARVNENKPLRPPILIRWSNDTRKTIRVFVMLKFLRDEIAAILHSRLPDPLGECDFIYFVLSLYFSR